MCHCWGLQSYNIWPACPTCLTARPSANIVKAQADLAWLKPRVSFYRPTAATSRNYGWETRRFYYRTCGRLTGNAWFYVKTMGGPGAPVMIRFKWWDLPPTTSLPSRFHFPHPGSSRYLRVNLCALLFYVLSLVLCCFLYICLLNSFYIFCTLYINSVPLPVNSMPVLSVHCHQTDGTALRNHNDPIWKISFKNSKTRQCWNNWKMPEEMNGESLELIRTRLGFSCLILGCDHRFSRSGQ